MPGRVVATFTGSDSGGICPCVTPPQTLSPPAPDRRVFVNKIPVMAAGDVLSPSPGQDCSSEPSPCTSPRTVVSAGRVFVNKKPIAHIGDILNQSTNIKIVGVPSQVFAGES
jgi:hypothetical protein